jgi:hypothetical protein
MRRLINLLTNKISSLLGTAPIKNILQDVSRIRSVQENILIQNFLGKNLYQNNAYTESKKITHYHRSIFTQNGEDGIIGEIFNRIGVTNKFFVEFGVHGVKNNSTFLLVNGWSGVWIGSGDVSRDAILSQFDFLLDKKKLKYVDEWITRANISDVLGQSEVPKEFDLLSIDIDGNDFWVWEAIASFSPRVVCIEYNATFPPSVSWVMSYNEKHIWNGSSYFGASLKSLENLGNRKGYHLVGCDFAGCNAFFVRKDQNLDLFERPFSAENHYEPPRYFLEIPSGHQQGFGRFDQP